MPSSVKQDTSCANPSGVVVSVVAKSCMHSRHKTGCGGEEGTSHISVSATGLSPAVRWATVPTEILILPHPPLSIVDDCGLARETLKHVAPTRGKARARLYYDSIMSSLTLKSVRLPVFLPKDIRERNCYEVPDDEQGEDNRVRHPICRESVSKQQGKHDADIPHDLVEELEQQNG